MEEEVVELAKVEVDLPVVIGEQVSKMVEANTKVAAAKKKSEETNQIAIKAKEMKTGIFKNKSAIESLQETVVSLSDAQIQNVEAQSAALECQKVIAETTKYLFYLGTTNIAATRIVIKELQEKLQEANSKQIDDQTKIELINLIKQLKEQEDLYSKQQKTAEIIKNQEKEIQELKTALEEAKELNLSNKKKIASLSEEIHQTKEANRLSFEEHDRKIKKLTHSVTFIMIILIIINLAMMFFKK